MVLRWNDLSDLKQTKASITSDGVRDALQYFAGRVAHDLNNLLTPMMAYPDMLAPYISDEAGLRYLEAIESSAQSAIQFSERLANLSGLIRDVEGTLDPAEVAMKVLGRYGDTLADRRIQLVKTLAYGGQVRIHADVLSRVLCELIDNAINASGVNRVKVTLNHEITDCLIGIHGRRIPAGRYWKLVVSDNGTGVDEESLQDVVEPFHFAGGRRTTAGGGLGLSIVYSLLANFGCYLHLTNLIDGGLSASIYMPESDGESAAGSEAAVSDGIGAAPSAGEHDEAEAASTDLAATEDGIRLLVVDDERSIVNLFKMILENFIKGVHVDKAENGADAVAQFQKHRHRLLVMDLHMPVMDGQAAFFEIQSLCEANGWTVPFVIFCTGYAPRDALKQAVDADDRHLLLNKPVQSDVLVKEVKKRIGVAS